MGFCHGFATVDAFWDRIGQPWQYPKWRKWFNIRRSSHTGRLAQPVRAPALQAGGPQFEPATAHHGKDSQFALWPWLRETLFGRMAPR